MAESSVNLSTNLLWPGFRLLDVQTSEILLVALIPHSSTATRRADHGREAADEGTGAGGSRAEADERDPAESISVFRAGGARPPTAEMTEFIEENRGPYGVESICSVLPIAPSTFYEHQIRWRNPDRLPTRAKRDEALRGEIDRVWRENRRVYGAPKVWKQLNREHIPVARCTVERLMRAMGLSSDSPRPVPNRRRGSKTP